MKYVYITSIVLVIIGGINWGLIGFFGFDLVAAIFGGIDSPLTRIVYALVGIAALFCIPMVRPVAHAAERRHPTEHAPARP